VPETVLVEAPVEIVPEAHLNAITSVCAVPLRGSSSDGAALVTCSRGNGTFRLWTSAGTPLTMKLESGEDVEELDCNASVSKVIITVNDLGQTLIVAWYTAHRSRLSGIEIWNTTTGTYNYKHSEGTSKTFKLLSL
jgi:WD40 repeat protein